MVYLLRDGSALYFQDRTRKYPFRAGPEALPLLRGLLAVNKVVFARSLERVEATGDARGTLARGEAIYTDKPTMRSSKGLGTWSDAEYAHPGLQHIYLRLKSFQRFTESWALFERCSRYDGVLDAPAGGRALNVASLGGGPGYELLAFEWFVRYRALTAGAADAAARRGALASMTFPAEAAGAADDAAQAVDADAETPTPTLPRMRLLSLDLQPSWDAYVDELARHSTHSYGFAQWDIKGEEDALEAAERLGCDRLDLCIISNVFVYCTDEQTADVLSALLHASKGPRALMINERGAEQRLVEMLEARGCSVVRLLSQHAGRDDRQLLVRAAEGGATDERDAAAATPSQEGDAPVFPNVPYEESKGQGHG